MPSIATICAQCDSEISSIKRNYHAKYCSTRCQNQALKERWNHSNHARGSNTSNTGAVCELIACSDLVLRGWDVFRSISPGSSCDIVAVKDGIFLRIEVRSACLGNDDKLQFKLGDSDKCDTTIAITLNPTISITYNLTLPG